MSLEQAMKRPENYSSLPPQQQWEIDAKLGILDWDPTEEERKRYKILMQNKKK